MSMVKNITIAIDGPAGSGKSTRCKEDSRKTQVSLMLIPVRCTELLHF